MIKQASFNTGAVCPPHLFLSILLALVLNAASAAQKGDVDDNIASADVDKRERYTFSWNLTDRPDQLPRGGLTKGTPVTLDLKPSSAWRSLSDLKKSDFERDRTAILAMAGEYRASFEFLETIVFDPAIDKAIPYQSWGTEYIFVLKDTKTFISLQHILVMRMQLEDGEYSEPITIKHWRQDWQYEDESLNIYLGNNQWRHVAIDTDKAKGTWSQSVFQVDDSPRYESLGRWVHTNGLSTWESGETWRPLPRREFSVRDDYDLLVGTNRHSITPTGWVQEEDNLKVKLSSSSEQGQFGGIAAHSVLAREIGLNRYERIEGFDFSPATEYWDKTQDFWESVKHRWQDLLAAESSYSVKKNNGQSLLMSLMMEADSIAAGNEPLREVDSKFVASTLDDFISVDQ